MVDTPFYAQLYLTCLFALEMQFYDNYIVSIFTIILSVIMPVFFNIKVAFANEIVFEGVGIHDCYFEFVV